MSIFSCPFCYFILFILPVLLSCIFFSLSLFLFSVTQHQVRHLSRCEILSVFIMCLFLFFPRERFHIDVIGNEMDESIFRGHAPICGALENKKKEERKKKNMIVERRKEIQTQWLPARETRPRVIMLNQKQYTVSSFCYYYYLFLFLFVYCLKYIHTKHDAYFWRHDPDPKRAGKMNMIRENHKKKRGEKEGIGKCVPRWVHWALFFLMGKEGKIPTWKNNNIKNIYKNITVKFVPSEGLNNCPLRS